MTDAERITELEGAIRHALKVMGPEVPICSGCEWEWSEALRVLRLAIGGGDE